MQCLKVWTNRILLWCWSMFLSRPEPLPCAGSSKLLSFSSATIPTCHLRVSLLSSNLRGSLLSMLSLQPSTLVNNLLYGCVDPKCAVRMYPLEPRSRIRTYALWSGFTWVTGFNHILIHYQHVRLECQVSMVVWSVVLGRCSCTTVSANHAVCFLPTMPVSSPPIRAPLVPWLVHCSLLLDRLYRPECTSR